MRDPAVFRPPFVTETDEARWDDCVPCSILMLVSAWTLGEVTDQDQGPVMTARQLKRLREHMRDTLAPAAQAGGLRTTDAEVMVAREWPWLPPLRTPTPPFDELWEWLMHGQSVALWGNPAEVRKPDSPLRQWTRNDDFGHCLLVLRARGEEGYVMDPLGSGIYDGEWVPRAQIKRYAYLDGAVVRSCAVAPIGAQSLAAIEARESREHVRELRVTHRAEVDALNARIQPIEEAAARAYAGALDDVALAIEELR